jgi:hypothetical protein
MHLLPPPIIMRNSLRGSAHSALNFTKHAAGRGGGQGGLWYNFDRGKLETCAQWDFFINCFRLFLARHLLYMLILYIKVDAYRLPYMADRKSRDTSHLERKRDIILQHKIRLHYHALQLL